MNQLEIQELKRRTGIVYISKDVHDKYPHHVMRIMGCVLVYEMTYNLMRNHYRLFCCSPEFDEVPEGSMSPIYNAIVTKSALGNTDTIQFKNTGLYE